MTPPVPDGPDTELAAANDALSYLDAYARSRDHAHSGDARRWVEAVRAVLARPAAGRDLVEYRAMMDFGPRWMTVTKDEAAAELRRGRRVLVRSVSPWRTAQPDDVRPADEPRRCPMDGEPLIAMNAHRDGVTFYRHADGHGHLDARAELSAAPADDTAVQGWGDVESADFIERARAATAVGSFTAQFDHVYDPSGYLVRESVDHSTAVRIAAALSGAPADDAAAPVPYDDPEKET